MLQQSTAALLSARLRAEQSSSRLPSLVAGVVRGGSLIWADAVGRVDGNVTGEAATVETQYRIGSITKTFVAVLVLRLTDEGRVRLDDRLDRHVAGTAFGEATIAQLLSHAAGLQAETDGPWWERTPGASWEALAGSLSDSHFDTLRAGASTTPTSGSPRSASSWPGCAARAGTTSCAASCSSHSA